jgi:hypothetical protein
MSLHQLHESLSISNNIKVIIRIDTQITYENELKQKKKKISFPIVFGNISFELNLLNVRMDYVFRREGMLTTSSRQEHHALSNAKDRYIYIDLSNIIRDPCFFFLILFKICMTYY